jgi:phenylacetate-CoA ligase
VYQWLRDRRYPEACRELRENERASPDVVREIQRGKLRRLVEHAYRSVPYWRRVMDERGVRPEDVSDPESLRLLPVMTKRLIQTHGDELRAREVGARGTVRVERTGGSTGDLLVFEQDARFWRYGQANLARSYAMCGWRPGDSRAWLWAADDPKAHSTPLGRLIDWATNQLFLDSLTTSEPEMADFARKLERFRPNLLIGYVSALVAFAHVVASAGAAVRPDAIQASAEMLTQPERELLERTFGCPVFDRYGSREVLNMAHECEAHRGLHVFTDLQVVEVLDGDRPAASGTPGRVVVTSLENYAFPFIRYEIGDVAVRAGRRCPCGRPFPLLDRVEGRVTDLIVSPSGRILQDEFFTRIIYGHQGIRRFQVVQESGRHLTVAIVPAEGLEPGTCEAIEREILERGDPSFEVEFRLVPEISLPPSGKLRTTISNVALHEPRTERRELSAT